MFISLSGLDQLLWNSVLLFRALRFKNMASFRSGLLLSDPVWDHKGVAKVGTKFCSVYASGPHAWEQWTLLQAPPSVLLDCLALSDRRKERCLWKPYSSLPAKEIYGENISLHGPAVWPGSTAMVTQVSLFIKESLSLEGVFKHGWCLLRSH